jgi:hypothetical protein
LFSQICRERRGVKKQIHETLERESRGDRDANRNQIASSTIANIFVQVTRKRWGFDTNEERERGENEV